MDKKLLLSTYFKYLQVKIEDMPNNENNSFGYLLQYIGENNKVRVRRVNYDPVYESIGNAYDIIQRETNRLLGVGRFVFTPNGLRLKTSKKEISNIRYFHQSKQKGTYAKIPYKVVFMFRAIVNILEEMWSRDDAPPIPSYLLACIKKTYAVAFYQKQIGAYNRAHRENLFGADERIKWELKNDFESQNSPFRRMFDK